jgi:hypothetical protein
MIRKKTRQLTNARNIEGITPPVVKRTKSFKSRLLSKKAIIVYVVVLVLVTAGAVGLLVLRHPQDQDLNSVEVIKQKISHHMLLPKDEQPALATITDHTKLTTPFLKKTQNGDKVLIYQKAQRAIIYRPSIDRIVDVGPVSIETPKDTGN